jgi:hypothetical protein
MVINPLPLGGARIDTETTAGIRKEDIDGSDTAVYVGSFVKGE